MVGRKSKGKKRKRKSVLRRLAHEIRKGKLCCSFLVVGHWFTYTKADYDYQTFLKSCEKEYERRKREEIREVQDGWLLRAT
jgi:hypothetical protein